MTRLGTKGLGLSALAAIAAVSCGGTVSTGPDGGATTSTESNTNTSMGGSGGGGTTHSTSTTTTSGAGGIGGTGGTGVMLSDKVDLLLMIDNSRSMGDKQAILAATVPDLVRGFVNPKCVSPANPQDSSQWVTPPGPLDPCPAGLAREIAPVLDLHVGVISSSIGGHGSDTCTPDTFTCPGGAQNDTSDDKGRLISRLDPCTGGSVSTYQGQGFLAWDPGQKQSPPGEGSLGSIAVDPSTGAVTTSVPGLVPHLADLVRGAGQIGCGFESQLESWYRFLIDPEPYQTITLDPSTLRAEPQGIDATVLQQRADFLRSSSALVIVGLTDENDCSTKEYGQFWFSNQARDPSNPNKNFYLPKPRSECATNPADPCCRSCGQDQSGCPVDPNCTGALGQATDPINMRCFDQKRRFGIDFLYPIDRYVTGLTSPVVPNRIGDMVPNPIFTDLDPTDADSKIRDKSLVFLSFIAGVPWQDLARDPSDIKKGLKSASELSTPDGMGHTTWDYIVGNPAAYAPPLDPLMIESLTPRAGTNPFTGAALAGPSMAAGPGPNPINGREYTPGLGQAGPDDLEYACIFPIPVPRNCSGGGLTACDCTNPQNDNPLCEPDPNNGNARTLQVRAKAYPAIRELSLIKALGSQGIPGSVCPAQLNQPNAIDYGYRPSFEAILARVRPALGGK